MPQLLEAYSTKFTREQRKILRHNTSVSDLMEPFIRHTASLSRLFICVDAINESENGNDITALLLQLAERCGNIGLIISSTVGYSNRNGGKTFNVAETEMRAEEVNQDVRFYVRDALSENENLRTFSQSLKNDITEAILARSNGMQVFRPFPSQPDERL